MASGIRADNIYWWYYQYYRMAIGPKKKYIESRIGMFGELERKSNSTVLLA